MAVLGAYWFNAVKLPCPASHALTVKPKLKTCILVVDDSSFARKVLNRILKLTGHNVFEAEDGQSALDLYRANNPDLVLLDLTLPDFSGREVLGKLREIDPDAKVMMTVTDLKEGAKDEFMVEGALGFLYKPFGSEAVTNSVDSTLKDSSAGSRSHDKDS